LQEHLETIKRFNEVIVENSGESQLVLLSLPRPPKRKEKVLSHYMLYVDALTESLQRILFISGSGKEVITIDS
uniref:SLC12 domain-containing protein n=1 Tax=Gongylonema pulchrum TaxID=637853 RepID=A0A183EVQ6_9BILA